MRKRLAARHCEAGDGEPKVGEGAICGPGWSAREKRETKLEGKSWAA
jgi:hypothetical protein